VSGHAHLATSASSVGPSWKCDDVVKDTDGVTRAPLSGAPTRRQITALSPRPALIPGQALSEGPLEP